MPLFHSVVLLEFVVSLLEVPPVFSIYCIFGHASHFHYAFCIILICTYQHYYLKVHVSLIFSLSSCESSVQCQCLRRNCVHILVFLLECAWNVGYERMMILPFHLNTLIRFSGTYCLILLCLSYIFASYFDMNGINYLINVCVHSFW